MWIEGEGEWSDAEMMKKAAYVAFFIRLEDSKEGR